MTEKESQGNESTMTVYVNDQPVECDEQELTVRRLLELAGSRMEESGDQALLRELQGSEKKEYRSLDDTIQIRDEARFYTSDSEAGEEEESAEAESEPAPKTGLSTGNIANQGQSTSFSGGKQGGANVSGGNQPNIAGQSKPQGSQPQFGGQGGSKPNFGGQGGQKPNFGGQTGGERSVQQNPSTGTQGKPSENFGAGNVGGKPTQKPTPPTGGQGSGQNVSGTPPTPSNFNEGERRDAGTRRTGDRKDIRQEGQRKETEEKET